MFFGAIVLAVEPTNLVDPFCFFVDIFILGGTLMFDIECFSAVRNLMTMRLCFLLIKT